jgi:prophage DNA circulation protein
MSWRDQLQPASWRGIGFKVNSSRIVRGRRVAVHEYPFRDEVWVEDLGRGTRIISFTGFLVGDDCYSQRDALVRAAEQPGPGELIHPSLGSLQCALTEFAAGERKEAGRVVEIEFGFIQTQDAPVYPSAQDSTQDQVNGSADEAADSCSSDFADAVVDTGSSGVSDVLGQISSGIKGGLSAVNSAVSTVQGYARMANGLISDASRVVGAVRGVGSIVGGGSFFGRFDIGNLTSAPTSLLVPVNQALSVVGRTENAVNGLISGSIRAASNVQSAANRVISLASSL